MEDDKKSTSPAGGAKSPAAVDSPSDHDGRDREAKRRQKADKRSVTPPHRWTREEWSKWRQTESRVGRGGWRGKHLRQMEHLREVDWRRCKCTTYYYTSLHPGYISSSRSSSKVRPMGCTNTRGSVRDVARLDTGRRPSAHFLG